MSIEIIHSLKYAEISTNTVIYKREIMTLYKESDSSFVCSFVCSFI